MKKFFLALFLLVCMVLGLSCTTLGGDGETTPAASTASSTAPASDAPIEPQTDVPTETPIESEAVTEMPTMPEPESETMPMPEQPMAYDFVIYASELAMGETQLKRNMWFEVRTYATNISEVDIPYIGEDDDVPPSFILCRDTPEGEREFLYVGSCGGDVGFEVSWIIKPGYSYTMNYVLQIPYDAPAGTYDVMLYSKQNSDWYTVFEDVVTIPDEPPVNTATQPEFPEDALSVSYEVTAEADFRPGTGFTVTTYTTNTSDQAYGYIGSSASMAAEVVVHSSRYALYATQGILDADYTEPPSDYGYHILNPGETAVGTRHYVIPDDILPGDYSILVYCPWMPVYYGVDWKLLFTIPE